MSLHFIEQMSPLLNATDESTWFGEITRLAGGWGFDQVLLGMLPRPGFRFEGAYIRSNYAPSWRRTYDSEGLVHIDPTVEHCATRSQPLVWSPDIFTTDPQQSMYEEACAHGLRAGVTLPMHGPNQVAGMLCFVNDSHPEGAFWKHINDVLPNLVLLRDVVIDTSHRFLSEHTRSLMPRLTPRETEVLQWTARGKSTWEISHILSCSEAAVDFHMKNVRTKFGVNSRRAAAVIATQMGLIDPG